MVYPHPYQQPVLPPPRKQSVAPWLVAIVAAFLVGGALGTAVGSGGDGSDRADSTVTVTRSASEVAAAVESGETRSSARPPSRPAGPRTTFGDGKWRVGIDIRPGTYVTSGGRYCYWERLSGMGGEFGDIIANGSERGQTSVDIDAGDVGFKSRGCGEWTLSS